MVQEESASRSRTKGNLTKPWSGMVENIKDGLNQWSQSGNRVGEANQKRYNPEAGIKKDDRLSEGTLTGDSLECSEVRWGVQPVWYLLL